MNNKYYTPEIEEFHVGFEYEHLMYHKNLPIWVKEKFHMVDSHFSIVNRVSLHNKTVSVKHLDREDIEGEGWVIIHEDERRISFHKKPNKEINFSKNDRNVTISKDVKRFDISFEGTIKNKSVLKQILKMIGV